MTTIVDTVTGIPQCELCLDIAVVLYGPHLERPATNRCYQHREIHFGNRAEHTGDGYMLYKSPYSMLTPPEGALAVGLAFGGGTVEARIPAGEITPARVAYEVGLLTKFCRYDMLPERPHVARSSIAVVVATKRVEIMQPGRGTSYSPTQGRYIPRSGVATSPAEVAVSILSNIVWTHTANRFPPVA